jgi:Cytochrome P460
MLCVIRGQALAVAAVLTTASIVADQKTDVPYPRDFRSWQHVKSIVVGPEHRSFAMRGGIHHYYANNQAMKGYRTGKFPNGSMIVDEGILTVDGQGPAKGILLEGDRRGIDVMIKNDRLYKNTGGWGFEHFDQDGTTGALQASGQATCHECHAKAERDHVFSAVRK